MSAVDREKGFFVIQRKTRSSRLYRSLAPDQKAVFYTVLMLANWGEDAVYHNGAWHPVHRGELAHSLATIAEEAGAGVQVVRSTLAKMLADDSCVGGNGPFLKERWTNTATNTGLRILTICRYDEYQSISSGPNTPANTDPTRTQHGPNTDPTPREPEEQDQPEEQEKKKLEPTGDLFELAGSKSPGIKPADLQALWNEICAPRGCASWEATTGQRRSHVEARIGEHERWTLRGPANSWEAFFRRIAGSTFLTSQKNVGNAGWIFKPENFAKTLEGNYDNRDPPKRDFAKGRVGAEEVDHSQTKSGITSWSRNGPRQQADAGKTEAVVSGEVGNEASGGASRGAVGGPEGAHGGGPGGEVGPAPDRLWR